jgi:hypothetical protein
VRKAAWLARVQRDASNFNHEQSAVSRALKIRTQEFICRERASPDSERRIFWLAKVEEWEQCALDEIAFHFRECNPGSADTQTGTHY